MAALLLDFKTRPGPVSDYRRQLDLAQALAQTEFRQGSARFTREVFASNPDGVLVVRLACNQPGQLAFTLRIDGGNLPCEVRAKDAHTLVLAGRALESKHSDGKTGVNFQCWVRALNTGGTVLARNDRLQIQSADAVTLLVAANTTYGDREPEALCRQQLASASPKSYRQLQKRHVTDYQK